MKCKRCGAENAINRLYCTECGAVLEHDLAEIQSAVDKQIKNERSEATARSIHWFLCVAFIAFLAGYFFRRAYKDLPENDLVAFLAPPVAEVGELDTVPTADFGQSLPRPRPVAPPRRPPPRVEAALKSQTIEKAFQAAAVSVAREGGKEPLKGLLGGDVVLLVPAPGHKEPLAIHVADVRSLRPLGKDLWEVSARGLERPAQIPIPDADKLELLVFHRTPDGKLAREAFLLSTVREIKPL